MEIRKFITRLIKEMYREYGVQLNNCCSYDDKKLISCMLNTPYIFNFLQQFFPKCLEVFNRHIYTELLPKKNFLIKNVTNESYNEIIEFLIKNGIIWNSLEHLTKFKPSFYRNEHIHLIIQIDGKLVYSMSNDEFYDKEKFQCLEISEFYIKFNEFKRLIINNLDNLFNYANYNYSTKQKHI